MLDKDRIEYLQDLLEKNIKLIESLQGQGVTTAAPVKKESTKQELCPIYWKPPRFKVGSTTAIVYKPYDPGTTRDYLGLYNMARTTEVNLILNDALSACETLVECMSQSDLMTNVGETLGESYTKKEWDLGENIKRVILDRQGKEFFIIFDVPFRISGKFFVTPITIRYGTNKISFSLSSPERISLQVEKLAFSKAIGELFNFDPEDDGDIDDFEKANFQIWLDEQSKLGFSISEVELDLNEE